jgi:DNA repair exonuclease SbcCD nuclease subunit
MRIVHFSDIHFGTLTADPSAFFDKRLLGMGNYYLRRHRLMHREYLPRALNRIRLLAPDLVICTGDITCIGSKEEFQQACEALRPLVGNPHCEFVYIPGNHDCYVRDPKCRRQLAESFALLNGNRLSLESFPFELKRPGLRLFFYNGCQATSLISSAGAVPPETAARLQGWLEAPRDSGEKRILVGHYPLRDANGAELNWRRQLYGSEFLRHALDHRQLDVALCGHIHTPFRRDDPSGAMEICAGSLTTAGQLNVLDHSAATGKFSQFWVDVSCSTPAEVPEPLLAVGTLD